MCVSTTKLLCLMILEILEFGFGRFRLFRSVSVSGRENDIEMQKAIKLFESDKKNKVKTQEKCG